MDASTVISADLYRYWHVDYRDGSIRIVCKDGQILDDKLEPRHQRRDSRVATSTFDWEKWWIWSTTTRNDLILTEGFNPASPPPLHGRPSVYLDQNRWRTVADTLRDPARVTDLDELCAAQDLICLAEDGGIVLPLSTGHLVETAGLDGDRRYEVGVAMARLAGGWQIRNPLDLWQHEVELSIRGHLGLTENAPVLHPVVTEPGALFGRNTSLAITDETPELEQFMSMLVMPSVILDLLLGHQRMPKDPLTKWVAHHAAITAQIYAEHLPKAQRRRLARRRYWNENIGYYTAAYRRLSNAADFPMFGDRQLARLFADSRMVGLMSEIFIRRFIDHMTKWERNDLIDLLHLSSAAGYADYVCAETRTGTQLRDAQRTLGRPVTVYTTLSGLVAAIRRDGARTATERARSN